MKNSIVIMFVIGVAISGCNIVDLPYGEAGEGCVGPEGFNDTVYNDTTVNRRMILLEEFTGHKCPNCPEGATIAEDIKTANPDNFLSVAIHNSGAFSAVDVSDPTHPYPEDFETETGENLRIKYKFSAFPGGMLNRTKINGSEKVDYQKWEQEVNTLLANSAYMVPRFKLNLANIYNSNPDGKSVRIRYKATCLQNITGNIAIVAYLLENNIVAPQTDNRLTPSYVPDYVHNHVLRIGFPNAGSGKTLFTNPTPGEVVQVISENDEICTALDAEWKPENMDVVVFLYDSDSGEILHVEKTHMTN